MTTTAWRHPFPLIMALGCAGTLSAAEQKLLPLVGASSDKLGESVAVDDDLAVVGAPWADDAEDAAGAAAYAYVKKAGTWERQSRLPAYDTVSGDQLGFAVAATDGYAILVAMDVDDMGVAGYGSGTACAYQWNDLKGIFVSGFECGGTTAWTNGEVGEPALNAIGAEAQGKESFS